jgi:hypothetical protein
MAADEAAAVDLLLRSCRSPVHAAESGELHPNGIGTGLAGQARNARHLLRVNATLQEGSFWRKAVIRRKGEVS